MDCNTIVEVAHKGDGSEVDAVDLDLRWMLLIWKMIVMILMSRKVMVHMRMMVKVKRKVMKMC
ncbi:conserved hypothetical protein [Ricinus communis]|uniref:Uncharacterized protein n=1 Tax=Ricinus communis TaxID=3988 RepID=B9RU31_RICCO|nr:conserved hypothetical protein [Ricinus communis]